VDNLQSGHSDKLTDIDYVMESRLSDDIRLRADVLPPVKNVKNIFLTGGTGFLGAFLISEFLVKPDVVVYCLVRAQDVATALHRVIKS